jgi:hypothetical protein
VQLISEGTGHENEKTTIYLSIYNCSLRSGRKTKSPRPDRFWERFKEKALIFWSSLGSRGNKIFLSLIK